MSEERMSRAEKSGMEWIEKVSKMETFNISPYEINKSIVEFAKAIVELTYSDNTDNYSGKPEDFIVDETLPPSMQG